MPQLERHGSVFVLEIGDDENRFYPTWMSEVDTALSEIENDRGARALVTTASGKFFSNGLDLEWLAANTDRHHDYLRSVHALLARMLSLPVITIVAIQGYAFAAGAMLTLAHDIRVMRADRGFWCLPEVEIDIPFTPGMAALIQARLAPQIAHDAMTTGRPYGGSDALAAGIIEHAVAEADVVGTATVIAQDLASRAGPTLAAIKTGMYRSTFEALASTPSEKDDT